MIDTRLSILKAATALALCCVAGAAQAPATPQPAVASLPKPLPSFYRNVIVVDPAHGGLDNGAQLPDDVLEKSVTLAFAQRLRPLLAAQGFAVAATRDSDPAEILTADQRAGTMNHARPLACLLLHATSSGVGVHVASSPLNPSDDAQPRALRWDEAQAGYSASSLRLANEVGLALSNAHLPVILLRASVPPIDNLICPAIVVEIAPLVPAGGSRSPVTDAAYQQHVAEAIALGLASYRTHNAPAPATASPTQRPATPEAAPAPKPAVPTPAANPPAPTPAANPGGAR
ncbi:MAG: N-acetylmuramoyl-L-alanine amidase [Acidobacteria bacterium]|nr:N-acetylmuramoyl-L-alanine amidase [Acidobacteriota bacterium]